MVGDSADGPHFAFYNVLLATVFPWNICWKYEGGKGMISKLLNMIDIYNIAHFYMSQ